MGMKIAVSSRLLTLTIDANLSLEIYKCGSSVFVNLLDARLGTLRAVNMVKYHGDLITISRSSDGPRVKVREFLEESAHVTPVPL